MSAWACNSDHQATRSMTWSKLGTCHLLEGGRAGAILFSQVNFFYALPQFPAEKNVTLPLVWPKIVMTLPTLKDMTGIIKRDQLLPCDEGRRQYDIQEQVSKITSCIEAMLSTNNPGAAGKFYTTDYVLVPAD